MLSRQKTSVLKNTGGGTQSEDRDDSVPTLSANFTLSHFALTLVNNAQDKNGIKIFSDEFAINLKKYDENSSWNKYCYELSAKNRDFGILSISKNSKPFPLVSKILKQDLINMANQSRMSTFKREDSLYSSTKSVKSF